MSPVSKTIRWIVGLLAAVHLFSAVLATWWFGYVDVAGVGEMALLLVPLALACAAIVFLAERRPGPARVRPRGRPELAGRRTPWRDSRPVSDRRPHAPTPAS